MAAWTAVIALLFAFCLDRWFGEPLARVHPARWMRAYLGWMGGWIAPRHVAGASDWRAFWAGALAWYGGASICALLAWVLQSSLLQLNLVVAGLLLGALLKSMLSWRLLRASMVEVEDALAQSLDAGRMQLGRIVRHEVMQLSEAQVRERAIESLAMRLCDSVIAPVFWFLVAGLPGAVLYRFSSIAGSLWGPRGFRAGMDWSWAGRWAAYMDQLLSWIPSRITAWLIAALARRKATPGAQALNDPGTALDAQAVARALRLADQTVAVMLAWTCLAMFLLALELPW